MHLLISALALFAAQDESAWITEANCVYAEAHFERPVPVDLDLAQKICTDRYGWNHDEAELAFAIMAMQVKLAEATEEATKKGLDERITDDVVANFTPEEAASFTSGEGKATPTPILKRMIEMLRARGVTAPSLIAEANKVISWNMALNKTGLDFVTMRKAHKH